MESTLMQFELSENSAPGASLTVLGLTVLERNRRQLLKTGFVENFQKPTFDATSMPILKIRGDVQFLAGVYRELHAAISQNPKHSHQFQTAAGVLLPLEWDAGAEALCHRHTVSWPTFDATVLLSQQHPNAVQKTLADALFAEIFAGTEGWIARGLNKKISFRMTKYLVKTTITPNQITILNLLLGILGCLCFLVSSYWMQCLGALILQFNSIVDGCDGEVARLKVITSKIGGWLDTIADDILNNVMFVCLIFGIFYETQNVGLFNFGMASVVASLGVTVLIYQNLIASKTHNAGHLRLSWEKKSVTPNAQKSLFDKVKPLLKRDFFIFVVFVAVLLNVRQILLVFLLPVWAAFFLYLASFFHSLRKAAS